MLSGLLLLFVSLGVAAAPSAAAVDDPSRPDARVTHGPSCKPGGLVVEVTAGTAPYSVRLATTRTPGGEDEATIAPGTTVVLRSDDVDWGETIDGRLEFAALDGSGVTFVDELDNYSFTRPTEEDCDAVHDPTQPHPSPPASAPDGAGQVPPSVDGELPPAVPAALPPTEAAGPVAPGGTVTVDGTGFLPGEQVVVQLAGGTVLDTVTAAADGSVRVEVRIPERAATGPATLNLVGDDSALVAAVELQVATVVAPEAGDDLAEVIPLALAAGALVATAAGFMSVAGGHLGRRRPLTGSA